MSPILKRIKRCIMKQSMRITTCPTCGSKRIRRRIIDVKMTVNGKTRVVADVELEVCPDCGEKLFDREAMRQVEKVFPPRRHRAKAKKS